MTAKSQVRRVISGSRFSELQIKRKTSCDLIQIRRATSTMASARTCIAPFQRTCLQLVGRPQLRLPAAVFLPFLQTRSATQKKQAQYKKKKEETKKKKKKAVTSFIQYDLKNADQFSLCDAMRYVHPAPCPFRLGRPLTVR